MITPNYQLLSGSNWTIWQNSGGLRIPASVPGNIQNDLEQAGLLKPIFYGMGDPNLHEVALDDWWYETSFTPVNLNGERVYLYFAAVDYSCEVYLNDSYLGSHKGTFLPFSFDVTDVIVHGKSNILRVKIDRMPPELYDWIEKSDGKLSGCGTDYFFVEGMNQARRLLGGLKPICNFSYDWSTNVYTLGICKDVWLESCGSTRIESLGVNYHFTDNFRSVDIDAFADLDASEACQGMIRFTLLRKGTSVAEAELPIHLSPGENKAAVTLHLDQPELWWPVGHGAQPLYDMKAEVMIDGAVSHMKTETIGIRDVRWELTENAPKDFRNAFLLVLNGRPIRTVGSNLNAIDLYPGRASAAIEKQLIRLAVRGNMNTLRIHAAQGMLHDNIFSEADRQGILLLVDYPLGNCAPETDEATLAMLRDTTRILTRKYRCHPSIVEWCVGNELCWYGDPNPSHPAMLAVKETSEAEDGTRVVRASCPIVGSRHGHYDYNPDSHYELYNAVGELLDNVSYAPMMRNGEFATTQPCNLESFTRYIPQSSRWPFDPEDPVMIRKNVSYAVDSDLFWLNYPMIERMSGKLQSLDQMVSMGQYLGAEGIRYIIDSYRWMGKNMGGFTNWCYNEPWPNGAGCNLIDYDGRPVMAYHFAREALAPISIGLKFDSCFYSHTQNSFAAVRVTSDAPAHQEGLRFGWRLRDNHGAVIRAGEGMVAIDPWETKEVDSILLNPPTARLAGPVIAELWLLNEDGEILTERTYLFSNRTVIAPLMGLMNETAPDVDFGSPFTTTGLRGGLVRRTVLEAKLVEETDRRLAYEITNTGEMTALFPELHPLTDYRTDLYIDGNFTSIPPGESRRYTIETDGSFTQGTGLIGTGFYLTCFNAPRLDLPSSRTVLYMGRRDGTCGEYVPEDKADIITANGIRVDPTEVTYLCRKKLIFRFSSDKSCHCSVTLAAADRSICGVRGKIRLNGAELDLRWPGGTGWQKQNPEQLALPYQESFPFDALRKGENTLEIDPECGWFTWDSLKIQANE